MKKINTCLFTATAMISLVSVNAFAEAPETMLTGHAACKPLFEACKAKNPNEPGHSKVIHGCVKDLFSPGSALPAGVTTENVAACKLAHDQRKGKWKKSEGTSGGMSPTSSGT